MGLRNTFTSYIRFMVLLAPLIIIPTMAIFGSLFNGDTKGLFYILGLTITMTFGSLISAAVQKPGPGKPVEGKDEAQGSMAPAYSPACNIIGSSITGWGTTYSLPCHDALALAYTATYFLFPMFLNNSINFFVICGILLISILNAYYRILSPMFCVTGIDVVAGWGTGFILGAAWFLIIQYLGGSTYFQHSDSDRQQCKLDKKSFRCKKTTKAT
jgi:hypothetical protein